MTPGIEEVTPLYSKPVPCVIRVKDLYIANGADHDKVWIGETHGGEGGEFSKDKFYEVLREFYAKEF